MLHPRFTSVLGRLPWPRTKLSRMAPGAVLAAITVLATACGSVSGGSASSTIGLGISVPLSGSVGSSCAPMNQAMVAWFNHVNATGGIHGEKLKVDTRDDAYEAAEAVTNTRAFIAAKDTAVTGQCGSIQPPAQMPELQRAQIPFLFDFGSCDTCDSNSMYFNLMPDYGLQLAEEIPWVFQKNGPGSVAIMTSATPGAATITTNVENAAKKAGGSFVGAYSAPPGTADMTPYVLKMKATHPDYVVLNMTPQDAAVFTKAMTAQNFVPAKNLIGSSAISQQTFLSNVSADLDPKVIVTSDVTAPSAAGNTECAKVLKAANIAVSGVTLRGCGTAQVVAAALDQSKKPVTSSGLVSTLETWKDVKASEVYPPITFSKTNHIGVSNLYVFGVKNGQFDVIGQLG